ncbi:uncharacterized protein K452DRAFT_282023 [Aplosporella prunicola CBS 121167]|uniref:DUF7371 domain-containing protein n=1 Tax=Aplosporella prunicola CBS 121167 TaxID=1176127 RepID=A0A6A6BSH8_9PEZI|nr:uncharacterized protein K452DRAFT_282023 [Aplosporella prunicola CBS 121167]KAF2147036.1 hypothetical protein K452DRAFT_282023 [Aplosporella prunicola CBS 121167]
MCPEIGDFGKFTLKWDDVPGWSPEDNNTYTFPPVWNPYHHLIFANGYGYVPPPNEPFKPVSAPHMAIFLPNQTTTALEHPHAGILPPGGIGAGPRASQSAWWFDVYSSYFACDTATEPCTIQAIGYQYKPNIKEEYPRVMQNFSIPACPKNFTTECELKKVDFEPGFRALSSIQFQAFFEGNSSRQVFVMDDLALGWANNTCEAGLMRLRKK